MVVKVIKHNEEPLPWTCLFILSAPPGYLPLGMFLERDNGSAIDGRNGNGIGLDLCCAFHQQCVTTLLDIGVCL